MFYLLLLSGAAFVATGAVLAAQARIVSVGNLISRPALGLLAAFAVVRGAGYWAEMAALATGGSRAGDVGVATLHVALLAAAFALLFGFTLAIQAAEPRRHPLVPAVAVSSLAAWGISLAALLASAHGADRTVPPSTIQEFTRWLLEVPANVCGAVVLLGVARSLELESWVESRIVRAAGVLFVVHGVSDALDGLPPILHATGRAGAIFAGRDFELGLEVVETASAAAIAILLSEAFVFRTSQRLRREETHLRDDFIALVAHELGTPLAALELATERLELARRAARVVDPRLSSDVKACALTLRRIVTDLRDTSRIEALQLETDAAPIDLRPVLERAAEVASSHEVARPPVPVSCPDDLPLALADPARVDQILGNLLTNASKYASAGSPVIVEVEPARDRIVVRVVNEGPSIDPAEAARIFSRHYRAHAAIRGTARGLGLGLYVARALVEAQGGRIWVESRDARTAFCFTLPGAPALAADAAARAPAEDGAPAAVR